jgi:hydrogenase maturation protease
LNLRVRILCFGNLLAGDDGFGVHVQRRLSEGLATPDGLTVEVIDAGLLGMTALTYFEDCDHIIVVDALAYAGQVGKVSRLELAELCAPKAAFSAHALDLTHLFHVLPIVFEGREPPTIRIIGAEIAVPSGAFDMQLSPTLQAAIEPAVARIEAELAMLAPQLL